MAISSDTESIAGVHIAVGTRNKRVQVWALNAGNQLSNIFSVELSTTVLWVVHFLGGDMAVFGMYDGDIYTCGSYLGFIYSPHRGSVAIDIGQTLFLIDNGVSGFSLHKMSDSSCIRTYDTKPAKSYLKQVAFAENDTLVVGGSDNGGVYMFDKSSGALQRTLRHSKTGQVQMITVSSSLD
ncbi:hypothetical protein ID866_12737 [Astraeus odoratus]|nr:hypothetical protein ID866_12737 [Astraeus odoratus]